MSMDDITSKAALAAITQAERQRLETALAGLSDDACVRPATLGPWTIKDMMAHVAAWEQEFLGWYRAGLRGEVSALPDADNIDPINQQLYERDRDLPLAEVRRRFAASYRELLDALDAMRDDDLFTAGRFAWTGDRPLVIFFRANADEHYAEHADQLAAWRQAQE